MWKLTYKWATSHTEQAETLDRRPVLRQVQHVQERPLGIRRPQQRRLPGQVLLDKIERHVPVTGAASPMTPPWPSTGPNGAEGHAPAGQVHPAPAHQAGRALPALRGPPADRRQPPNPRAMGTMVAQVTRQAIAASYLTHHRDPAHPTVTKPASSTHPASGPPRPPAQETSTSTRNALAACPSRVRDEWHARFRGGCGAATRRSYPTGSGSRTTTSWCAPLTRSGRPRICAAIPGSPWRSPTWPTRTAWPRSRAA